MKRFWILWGISYLWFWAVVPVDGAAATFTLEIPAEVVVTTAKISLADLGRIYGANQSQQNYLRNLNLGEAPLPGQTRVFSRSYLKFILQQHPAEQVPVLKMGDQVTVRARATAIRGTEIAANINQLLPQPPAGVIKQWVEVSGLPETVWMPQGNYRIEAAAVGQLPQLGRAMFKVKLVGPTVTKEMILPGVIHQSAPVYRAKKLLKQKTVLKPEDFDRVVAELADGREYLGNFPQNCRVVKRLRPGQILTKEALQPVPLVAKGSEVKVVVRSNGIEITLEAVAKSDGWFNDSITLLNPESNKEFTARVSGNGVVEVKVQ
ncbi:MAG TPA: flagellar basal body P-ring formation chaperone FlgA [Bacillota bacterium]